MSARTPGQKRTKARLRFYHRVVGKVRLAETEGAEVEDIIQTLKEIIWDLEKSIQ